MALLAPQEDLIILILYFRLLLQHPLRVVLFPVIKLVENLLEMYRNYSLILVSVIF